MGIDDIRWLKIAGTNEIVVDGKIQIAGVKITSWDTQTNSPVFRQSWARSKSIYQLAR
jgi:hypothetical protein